MSIGIWQVVLILLIVLIMFGAGKLPQVMGDVAKGVKSFKAGLKDDEDEHASLTSDAGEPPGRRARPEARRAGQELRPRTVAETRRCSTSAGRRWPSSCWSP